MSAPRLKIKNQLSVPQLSKEQLEQMRQNITASAIERGFDPKSARAIVDIFVDEQRPRSNNKAQE